MNNIMTAQLREPDPASPLARAVVDIVRQPLLALDENFRVVVASRSFHLAFGIPAQRVLGHSIYDVGEGQFDQPPLRHVLENARPDELLMTGLEFDAVFPSVGQRTLLLDACKVFYDTNGHKTLLLTLEDVTERRAIELEKEALLRRTEALLLQKEMLLQEMQHRVANSLQIIASILLMKANTVTSEETRQHLQDAHRRVMSIATVQQHIQVAGQGDVVHIRSYLSKLCASLTNSMIGDSAAISLRVVCSNDMTPSAHAVSVGLIVMELVINALKYAFPHTHSNAQVLVSYETSGTDWRLAVSDNGIGSRATAVGKGGLGTTLVKALAQQLDAQVETILAPTGTSVSITHATFAARLPQIT